MMALRGTCAANSHEYLLSARFSKSNYLFMVKCLTSYLGILVTVHACTIFSNVWFSACRLSSKIIEVGSLLTMFLMIMNLSHVA